MVLEREVATYREKLPELLQHEGKCVLIYGDAVIGIFATREDALRQGYSQFPNEPFLARWIFATKPVAEVWSVLSVERIGQATRGPLHPLNGSGWSPDHQRVGGW